MAHSLRGYNFIAVMQTMLPLQQLPALPAQALLKKNFNKR